MLESLLMFLIVSAVVGFLTWLVTTKIPMPSVIASVIQVAVAIALLIWLIKLFTGNSVLHLS